MTWSFTNIANPVECVYTQTVGFSPDVALLKANPQVANVPEIGTLSFTWDATTVTLPNSVVDLASLQYTPDGQYVTLRVWDRRKLWERVEPISGEYNTMRAGVVTRQKTLRELGTILMTALGEPGANVSALPTTIYPPVSWQCDDVVEVAEVLFSEYGYTVALGFDSEAVTVVKLGTGATLSTTDMFAGTTTMDPKLAPQYVRNCFSESVAQVRMKLEAVGLDTDGTWQLIDDLSFAPGAGWALTPPYTLGDAAAGLTDEQKVEAQAYVRSAYRISGFADETWEIPDGSEQVITGLDMLLPVIGRLLTTEDIRPDDSYAPFRVYGKYLRTEDEVAQGLPLAELTTDIEDRVTGRAMHLDEENGILIFKEPIYYVDTYEFYPADLWIELTVRIREADTGAWRHYEYDVDVNPGGIGYHTVRHENRAETIVEYDDTHAVTGYTNNQTALDSLGDAAATAAAGAYTTSASQLIVYNQPKVALRCDGAIVQIKHVFTYGEDAHAVNRTTAARNFEFDHGIPSRAQRAAHLRAMQAGAYKMRSKVKESRVRDKNV